MFKQIYGLWNDNFKKGVTIFQICLMATMVYGAFTDNNQLTIFSMVNCLFGYFEPNQDRFSLGGKKK